MSLRDLLASVSPMTLPTETVPVSFKEKWDGFIRASADMAKADMLPPPQNKRGGWIFMGPTRVQGRKAR